MIPFQKYSGAEGGDRAYACGAVKNGIYLSPTGKILPCMTLGGTAIDPMFDSALEKPLSEILSDSHYRNMFTDGCAATVEPKSWCDSNNSCIFFGVTYNHEPANVICPKCGAFMYVNWVDYASNPGNDTFHYKCKNCGCEKTY